MRSTCCLCITPTFFRFLCGPCRIKGKQAIGSSQNFLFEKPSSVLPSHSISFPSVGDNVIQTRGVVINITLRHFPSSQAYYNTWTCFRHQTYVWEKTLCWAGPIGGPSLHHWAPSYGSNWAGLFLSLLLMKETHPASKTSRVLHILQATDDVQNNIYNINTS
jgi:hypothetical protein